MARLIKWLIVGSGALMLLLFLLVLVLAIAGPMVSRNSILIVDLDGELRETPEDDLLSAITGDHAMTLRGLTDAIRGAAEDERIAGLLVRIKNPVVGVAQLQEIEEAMATFRATGKWNAAHLATAGEFSRGDGAYALAACADRVLLSPPGDINLVGLQTDVPFLKGLFEKLRIGVHFDKRYEYKNAANTFTHDKMTEAHREAAAALVDDLEQSLLEQIAARRHVTIDVAKEWVATGPHLGSAALEAGLVDALAYWDEALAEAEVVAGRGDPFVELGTYASRVERHDSGPRVALIYGAGTVVNGESEGGGNPQMGAYTVSEAFRDAREAEVEGVLFRVDSPGGSYVASDVIRREVEVTRDAGIPVVVSMGNVAASGGYFVAMDADKIIAQTGTITGSIGVFAGSWSTREFWKHWLGVTFDGYQSAPNADFFDWLDPPDAEDKARVSSFLDRVYEDFVTKAAAGRSMTPEKLEPLARGRVWSGRAAKEQGLVDEIGGMERALEVLKEAIGVPTDRDVTLVVYPKPKTTFELLNEQLNAAVRLTRMAQRGVQIAEQMRPGRATLRLWLEPRL